MSGAVEVLSVGWDGGDREVGWVGGVGGWLGGLEGGVREVRHCRCSLRSNWD